ncbi:hypothetical protein F5883DRAFT_395991, partial [Diaporthe sp. PMI_573]
STVFQLFPVLAPEIRRLIWERELLCPSSPIRKWNNRKFSFALRRPVPPVLQVCRETRLWFIQRSRERSKNTLQFAVVQHREGEEGYVYIDCTTDTVYIHREYLIPDVQFSQIEQLQHLRMSWGLRPCWLRNSLHRGVNLIMRFPCLKSITLEV